MRGKVVLLSYDFVLPGITPAYAGKRKIPQIVASKCRDHPRLCGEKSSGIVTSVPPLGSPPPMRGKVFKSCCIILCSRITPAYAGKSAQVRQCQGSSRDHPRLCGEKTLNRKGQTRNLGSPPPMRGKVRSCHEGGKSPRITPAYAGKRILRF